MISQNWECDGCGIDHDIPYRSGIEGWWTGMDDEGNIVALACSPACIAKATTKVEEVVTGWSLANTDQDEDE